MLLNCVATLWLALLATAPADASDSFHPQDGPHVDLRILVNERDLTLRIAMNLVFLDEMVESPREQLGEMTPAEGETAREILLDYFKAEHPVTIDGIITQPVLEGFEITEPDRAMLPMFPRSGMRGLRKIMFDLRYPIKAEPRAIEIVWHCYPPNVVGDPEDPPPLVIQAELTAEETKSIVTFTTDERGYTWRPTGLSIEDRFLEVPAVPTPNLVSVPAFSIGSIVVGIIFFLGLGFAPKAGWRPAVRLLVLIAAGLTATLNWNSNRIEMQHPFEAAVTLPSELEAQGIFEPLHANIYRAFDYSEESDIYDALAQSVDGQLLDTLYDQMYESLIMYEEGGAMSTIDEVRPVSVAIASIGILNVNDDQPVVGFNATYRWQVDGSVYHWGHGHRRTNEYSAEYTVVAADDGWRISDCRIIEQIRIPIEGEDSGNMFDGDFEI